MDAMASAHLRLALGHPRGVLIFLVLAYARVVEERVELFVVTGLAILAAALTVPLLFLIMPVA